METLKKVLMVIRREIFFLSLERRVFAKIYKKL